MQEQMPTPTTPTDGAPEQEPMGIDSAISTVESFMADPKSVTPETLGQLKMDLEDLKTILEPESAGPQGPQAPPDNSGGMAGMISKMRNGG